MGIGRGKIFIIYRLLFICRLVYLEASECIGTIKYVGNSNLITIDKVISICHVIFLYCS